MKRVIAVSDSHGREERLRNVLFAILSDAPADVVVFLGDGFWEWDTVSQELLQVYPRLRVYGVRGNNDYSRPFDPDFVRFSLGGVNFIACHGHRYGVKTNLDRLEIEAVACNAQVALYGHTHIADICTYFNCVFVNPGAVSGWGSYAPVAAEVLVSDDKKVTARLITANEVE